MFHQRRWDQRLFFVSRAATVKVLSLKHEEMSIKEMIFPML